MPLFLSKYTNKLDSKGRVSVPAPFRGALYSDDFSGVILFASPKYQCLEGFDMKSMESIAGRLDQFDMFSSEQDDMAAAIFGAARPLSLDGQGRIVLPEDLIVYAGLKGHQVVIVGLGRKFQIWNPALYEKRQNEARQNVESKGLTLPRDLSAKACDSKVNDEGEA